MRSLEKLPKPKVLERNEEAAYVASNRAREHEKWRHKNIKATLFAETDGKCAYCESAVQDVAYPHVEHIIPKSARPDLAHHWPNLTSACPRCNVGKDATYDPTENVLNPYVDDLEMHLEFHGDLVDCPLGDRRGALTIVACDLNRYDLVRSRVIRIRAVRELVERWHSEVGAMRSALAIAIRLDARQGEFTAHVTAYLRRIGFPLEEPG